ncbi:MAG: DUF1835 domain-containing protein [Bacteroidota bacterium]|nr:DUF1835 domain-containing protein [Bacteroidota bacterium]
MLHIVFQDNDIQTLQKAMELDEALAGEIVQIKDDFAVGPIENIYETEGYQQRRSWWKEVIEDSPYADSLDIVNDKLTVHTIIQKITKENETVLIWIAPNQHDVCGYYWLISQLAEWAGKVFIVNLSNLPFINEKGGLFYPENLYQIQPKEFIKAKKLARPITTSEFEMDSDEWKKRCNENAIVRVYEGGKKIKSKEAAFYDESIFSIINKEPQKLSKILHSFYAKTKVHAGDAFIAWHIKRLAEKNKIIIKGHWSKGWKDITVQTLSYQQAGLSLG